MTEQQEMGFAFKPTKAEDIPQRGLLVAIRTARILQVPQVAVIDGSPRQLVIQLEDGTHGWLATPAGFISRQPNPGDYVIAFADGSIGWLPGAAVDAHFEMPPPYGQPANEATAEPLPGSNPDAPQHPYPEQPAGEQQPEQQPEQPTEQQPEQPAA